MTMAAARQRAEWFRVGVATAWIVNRNGWTKEPIHPLAVIPEAYRPEPESRRQKSPEEAETESRRAWQLVDRFFGGA